MRVVILSYNHPELSARVTRSALQFFKPEQIHLVHNGSDEHWVRLLKEQYPNINHLVQKSNTGYSGGANLGLKEAFQFSEWVLFLTNDCELLKNVTDATKHKPGIYSPHIYARKVGRTDSLGGGFDFLRTKLTHFKSSQDFENYSENSQGFTYVPGTAYLIHRMAFEQLNGFDESYGTYWEDVDFSFRAHQAKIKIGYAKDIEILHGVGKTCHKHKHYTLYLYQRNRLRFHRKYSKEVSPNILVRIAARYYLLESHFHIIRHLFRQKRWQDFALFRKAFKDARDLDKLHYPARLQGQISKI